MWCWGVASPPINTGLNCVVHDSLRKGSQLFAAPGQTKKKQKKTIGFCVFSSHSALTANPGRSHEHQLSVFEYFNAVRMRMRRSK